MITKVCTKCKVEKPLDEFNNCKLGKYGKKPSCKQCCNKAAEKYREKNKYEIKDRQKRFQDKNKDRIRAKRKEYYKENRERLLDKSKKYNKANRDKINITRRKYNKKNTDRVKALQREWWGKNKDEINNRRNKRDRERRKTDPVFRIQHNVSNQVNRYLKKGGGSKNGSKTFEDLPYTPEYLTKYIESQFEPWMSWDNYGKYDPNRITWQLDHIIPHSTFKYTEPKGPVYRACWALPNLRPLKAIENIKKKDKII
jgi:hypothetical protein